MRLERRPAESSPPALGALYGAVLVLVVAAAGAWLRLGLPRPSCPFRALTGLPCPTCGSTRMLEALLGGDLAGALAWNPLVFSGLAILALWSLGAILGRALRLPAWRLTLEGREAWVLRVSVVLATLAGWGYLIRNGV